MGKQPERLFHSFNAAKSMAGLSTADVKMEKPVLVWSLKSSILSSTSFQVDKTFWGIASAAVEQSRRKANMVARGDGNFGSRGWPQNPSKKQSIAGCSWTAWNHLSSFCWCSKIVQGGIRRLSTILQLTAALIYFQGTVSHLQDALTYPSTFNTISSHGLARISVHFPI